MDLNDVVALERSTPELPHWPRGEYERYVPVPMVVLERVLFVAEEAEVILGFAAAALNPSILSVAELESIAVLPNERRSGIGGKLLHQVMEWCRDQGSETLELEVRSRSAGAIALYRSFGFQEVRMRSRYYAQPADDALVMARVL